MGLRKISKLSEPCESWGGGNVARRHCVGTNVPFTDPPAPFILKIINALASLILKRIQP